MLDLLRIIQRFLSDLAWNVLLLEYFINGRLQNIIILNLKLSLWYQSLSLIIQTKFYNRTGQEEIFYILKQSNIKFFSS